MKTRFEGSRAAGFFLLVLLEKSWYISAQLGSTYLCKLTLNAFGLTLCAEAAICEDPQRLEQLACQIAEILGKEQHRLNAKPLPASEKVRKQGAA